jgi:formylglycine-generating enzyme required for sulfatase activity
MTTNSSNDETNFSDEPGDLPSLFRKLVGASVSDEAVLSISEHFSSMAQSDDGIDLYSKLPPVGDPARHEKLLDLLFADVAIRRHLGTELSIHQYLRKYPELKREEVLGAFEAMGEQAGPPQKSNIHSFKTPTANSMLRPVGEYKLLKQLGVGGFGEVWLADAPGGVPVAVKIIKRPIDDYTARQEHQALLLVKGLSHPCLVQTQAYWVLDDRLVIAMELCEQNLRQRLKECQALGLPGVPKKELLKCFRSAAEALDHLHTNRVHHRDIKPENLLLHHGHLKIADFGLAFLYDGEASMMTAPEAGTGRYMAPEVWNRKLSKHSDQYSLALAYAELRLGRPIITGKGTVEFMKQHLEQEPNLDGLPMDEADIVRQALAKNPHDRFESCAAFMDALEATEKPEATRTKRWVVPMLAGALIIVLGAFAYSQWYGTNRSLVATVVPKFPTGTEPVGKDSVNDRSKVPWYRTVRVVKAGAEVAFAYVAPTATEVAPFYISQTKITNGVMKAAFNDPEFKDRLKAWKELVGPNLEKACFPNVWEKGGADGEGKDIGSNNDQLPAFRMTAAEAAVVAEWLGGKLPTPNQWKAAAGIDGGHLGPFQLPPEKVARNQSGGPANVKAFPEDLSVHGVFDVAGNGREWTRIFVDGEKSLHDRESVRNVIAKQGAEASITLRGFEYLGEIPPPTVLKRVTTNQGYGTFAWADPQPDIGFRVVIDP